MASICPSVTTKRELLLLPQGEPLLLLELVAQAACTAFGENNSLARLQHLSRASKDLRKFSFLNLLINSGHMKDLSEDTSTTEIFAQLSEMLFNADPPPCALTVLSGHR